MIVARGLGEAFFLLFFLHGSDEDDDDGKLAWEGQSRGKCPDAVACTVAPVQAGWHHGFAR